MTNSGIAPIEVQGLAVEQALANLRAGGMAIVVDGMSDDDVGSLICAADKVTPDTVNFMAKHARGLVCLALTRQRAGELGLSLQPRLNAGAQAMHYTVSIEAREGVSTGISAADRAHTIVVATASPLGAKAIATPGHIIPHIARDGGVLVRAGHTEAAVDLARLADLRPAAASCQILNDEGDMARLDDLRQLSKSHAIPIVSITDVIAFRRRREVQIERIMEREISSMHGGNFRLIVYRNRVDDVEHVALVKGNVGDGGPVLVRMHAVNLLDDIIADRAYSRVGELHPAMERIGWAGRGVVVLMREAHNSSPSEVLRLRDDSVPESGSAIRDYGTGAQILRDLGVRHMKLLSRDTRIPVGLEGYELDIVEHIDPLTGRG